MRTKVCTKCKKRKKLKEFYKNRTKRDGHNSRCISCAKKYFKNYFQIHKEEHKKRCKKYHDTHKEQKKLLRLKNKQKIQKQQKEYYLKNKEKIAERDKEYRKNKYHTDINFKIRCLLRKRIYKALHGKTKSKRTLELLGCSIEFLKAHLEKQFKSGMNWDNHSRTGWHIDHIKPCDKFDLTKKSEQEKCFHYTNLQPLWAEENLTKGVCYQDTDK